MQAIAYAGSFDPFTKGHEWMVDQALTFADHVTIVVANNPSKKYMFPLSQRIRMVEQALQHHKDQITVVGIEHQYVAEWAFDNNLRMIRGLRTSADFDYEQKLNYTNTKVLGGDQAIFLMPPPDIAIISSSYVKGFIGPIGWHNKIKQFLSPSTYRAILIEWLRSEWNSTFEKDNYFQSVINAYSEPNRHYHNIEHLVHMLSELKRIEFEDDGKFVDHNREVIKEIKAAIFYHDIGLDENGLSSEELSAQLYTRTQLMIDPIHGFNVVDLILATKHSAEKTKMLAPAEVLVSIDLAILGRPTKEYIEYRTQIRQEYSQINDVDYYNRRSKILESLLKKAMDGTLYPAKTFHKLYNEIAKANIALELVELDEKLKASQIVDK